MKEMEVANVFDLVPKEPLLLKKDGKPVFVLYPVAGVPMRTVEMITSILERKPEPGYVYDDPGSIREYFR